jgi:hypothetical protein
VGSDRTRIDCRIPLVVGVVGHRDLTNAAELRPKVLAFLAALKARVPHTPIVLLTSLAPGADQLVAREAARIGIEVVPVLPLRPNLYKRSFIVPGNDQAANDRARAEFDALVGPDPFVLAPVTQGPDDDSVQTDEKRRNAQFAAAGAYIVRASHTLLALWTGADQGNASGTAVAVRFAEHGVPPEGGVLRDPLDLADGGVVAWFLATRRKHEHASARTHHPATGEFAGCEWVYPRSYPDHKTAAQLWANSLSRLDDLNQDLVGLHGRLAEPGVARALDGHVVSLTGADGRGAVSTPLHWLLEVRARVDFLSTEGKSVSRNSLQGMFTIIIAAVLVFEVFAHFLPSWTTLLVAYALLLVLALRQWYRREDRYRRYVDYRALAEALRVQYHWSAAGLKDVVSDYFMRTQRTEVEWVRQAVLSVALRLRLIRPGEQDRASGPGITQAVQQWIGGQLDYFAHAAGARRDAARKQDERMQRCALGAVLVVLAMVVHGFMPALSPGEAPGPPGLLWVHLGTIAIVVLLVGAELARVYRDANEFAIDAKRFAWMLGVYRQARSVMARCPADHPECHALALQTLHSLGRIALAENAEWIVLHRHRPVDLPHSFPPLGGH